MAALLTSVLESTGKLLEYIGECRDKGIRILPPHVNRSVSAFVSEGNSIRFGLLAVKGLGRAAIENLVAEREENGPFCDFLDFCTRLHGKDLNRRGIESLIRCGALDGFGHTRREMFNACELIMEAAAVHARNEASGQMSLFGDSEELALPPVEMPVLGEYSSADLLKYEYESLGFYLTGHPLEQYEPLVQKHRMNRAAALLNAEQGTQDKISVRVLGTLSGIKTISTKSGKPMCFAKLEDMTGVIELVIFPKILEEQADLIRSGEPLVAEGNLSLREDEDPKILCSRLLPLGELAQAAPRTLYLRFTGSRDLRIQNVLELLGKHPGTSPVQLYFTDEKRYCYPPGRPKVTLDEKLLDDLRVILGRGGVVLK